MNKIIDKVTKIIQLSTLLISQLFIKMLSYPILTPAIQPSFYLLNFFSVGKEIFKSSVTNLQENLIAPNLVNIVDMDWVFEIAFIGVMGLIIYGYD